MFVVAYFMFQRSAATNIYTLSLHDALPIWPDIPIFIFPSDSRNQELTRHFNGKSGLAFVDKLFLFVSEKNTEKDRKSTRLNSSHVAISYAVFCLKHKRYNKKFL